MADDLLERLLEVFTTAYSSLGPKFALFEHERIGSADRPSHLVTLQPTNPRAARIYAALVGPVYLTIGRNSNSFDLNDLMESADEAAAVTLTRDIVDAVINGGYHETSQRVAGRWAVSLVGYLALGGKEVGFGRGFSLPLVKEVRETYEPYRMADS